MGRTVEAGYGEFHRRLRRVWARRLAVGPVECARCHRLIMPGELWDLGHVDGDKSRYQGPEHRGCNRATSRARIQFRSRDW